jgi:hypothetical protein
LENTDAFSSLLASLNEQTDEPSTTAEIPEKVVEETPVMKRIGRHSYDPSMIE